MCFFKLSTRLNVAGQCGHVRFGVFFPVDGLTYAVLDFFHVQKFSGIGHKKTLFFLSCQRWTLTEKKGKTLSRLPLKGEKGKVEG